MEQPPEDPTPLWVVGLVVFGVAGIGAPLLYLLFFWVL